MDIILKLEDICKSFPGVKALDHMQIELARGEMHAVCGENGAGKSTMMKVITGVYKADSGNMYLNGEKGSIREPNDAYAKGIAIIFQEPSLFKDLTVVENIFMGHEMKKRGVIQWKEMNDLADSYLEELNADFKSTAEMGALSVAQQQMVEIAKAISMKARIIIMDEPTAALTKNESEQLYKITEKLRDGGASVIFISHRFEDMYRLATRVTVFRDSQYIGSYDVNGITNADLIKAMVGREISDMYPKPEVEIGEEVLRVEKLTRMGYFKDVSFSVRKGEILGLTGLVGAGRTETVQTIYGVEHYDSGKMYLNGKEITVKNPSDALRQGIGLLPEDRQHQGLILDWGIGRNITLTEIASLGKNGMTDEKAERAKAKELAERVDTKAVTIFDKASSLSGGNQQKIVVAKILASDLKVIILDEPTKGVDVGAKAEIYEIMGELAKQGYAIIMISSEMPEILGMSDRIVVMCEGRVTGELKRGEAAQEEILKFAMARSPKTAKN